MFVLDLFDASNETVKEKANQGKQNHGFGKDAMADYLAIQTHNHAAVAAEKVVKEPVVHR